MIQEFFIFNKPILDCLKPLPKNNSFDNKQKNHYNSKTTDG